MYNKLAFILSNISSYLKEIVNEEKNKNFLFIIYLN